MNETFWVTWGRHRDYLLTLCLRWLNGNYADAEDALSRTALRAYESASGKTSHVRNPKSWFARIAHNISVDLHREQQRNTCAMERIGTIAEDEGTALVSSPSEQVILLQREELSEQISHAIERLPAPLREVCVLRFLMELPYSEIARRLSLTNENVRKRIQLARRQLREYLPDR